MRCLISGTRHEYCLSADDVLKIRRIMVPCPLPEKFDTVWIVGDCPTGVDKLAKSIIKEFDMPHEFYEANWTGLGKLAGPTRNTEMFDKGKPDFVFVFPCRHSKGTLDVLKKAFLRRITVEAIPL